MSDDAKIGCGVLIMFAFITVGMVLLTGIHFSSTGPGAHTGYVTAVEQEGWFFKNYRVYVKTDNSSSQEDIYCLDRSRQDLVRTAQEVSKKRELVTVEFAGVRGFGWGLCHDIQITGLTKDG